MQRELVTIFNLSYYSIISKLLWKKLNKTRDAQIAQYFLEAIKKATESKI